MNVFDRFSVKALLKKNTKLLRLLLIAVDPELGRLARLLIY